MNRAKILAEFMENMMAMRKAFFPKPPHAPAKDGLPTRAQFGILATIGHEGPQSIKELAGRFGMTSSAATQAVHGLVKAKLLTRKEDSKDRRRICAALTKEGAKRLEKAKQCHGEALERILSVLNDQELVQLQKIQKKLLTHLS